MKRTPRILILITSACLLGSAAAPAAVHITVDRSDGSWSMAQTSSVDVGSLGFFGTFLSLWQQNVPGPSVSSSSATFTYTGIYNGSPISDSGTINLSSVSDTPQALNLSFGPSVTATGSFSNLVVTSTTPLSNPLMWSTLQDGFITASIPPTNAPAQVTVVGVPEPSTLLLGGLGAFVLLVRRRR